MVQNILSNLNIIKHDLVCRQFNTYKIVLKLSNSNKACQAYGIHIFDEDSTFFAKE
jgi:hypothetical protein